MTRWLDIAWAEQGTAEVAGAAIKAALKRAAYTAFLTSG